MLSGKSFNGGVKLQLQRSSRILGRIAPHILGNDCQPERFAYDG
jgi:hypothetical protein